MKTKLGCLWHFTLCFGNVLHTDYRQNAVERSNKNLFSKGILTLVDCL